MTNQDASASGEKVFKLMTLVSYWEAILATVSDVIIMEKNEQNMRKENIQGSTASPPGFSATQTSEGGTSPLRSVFRGKWMAWIILLASLAVTFFAWHLARSVALERANDRFVFRTKTIESALRERLHACAFLLQSGAGLFADSMEVTRAGWRTYVTALHIDKHYQAVQGLGFSKRILPSEKKAHIRQIREEGFPNYDIHPDGERPEYTSIIFLEPFDWRNQRAFGYDMFSEPTRKEAMVMARDTGSAALSGKVTLLQETEKDVQAGFLMYLPVYRKGEVPETPEQRHEALTGYVYSPFRMNDFMQGLLKEKREYVELQIFDGDEPLKEALLYPGGNMESLLSRSDHVHFATCQSILEYAGRRWLLVFKSSPNFEETIDTGQVNSILLLGIIISLLLFSVVLSLTKSRNQALSLANMTLGLEKANLRLRREIEERKQAAQNLEEAEFRFKSIFNAALDGILVADAPTKTFVMGNNAICDMLGYQPEELIRLGIKDIHPAEALPEVLQQFERQAKGEIHVESDLPIQRKDGSVFYADVSATSMVLAGRPLQVGIFHDVTERKRIEETLRYKNTVLSILQRISPSAILVVDENARIVSYNEKFIHMWDLPSEMVRTGIDEPVLRKVLEQIENPEEFLARVKYLYGHKEETSRDELLLLDGRIIDRHSSPVTDDDGRYYGRVWDFRDITELKRATEKVRHLNDELELKVRARTQQLMDAQEELEAHVAEIKQAHDALNQTLEYANTLIRSSPDGVLAVDLDLRITELNLLMEQICGKSREQAIGQDLAELPFMKATGEGVRIREGLEGQNIGPREVAYRLPGTDKESFFESIMATLRGPAGQIVGAVLRVRDITKRKRVEEAVIQSENRLRTILESVQAGIVIIDPEAHRIVDVNLFAARMIGVPKESIIGAECHKFICPAERDQCPVTDLKQTIDHSERVLLTAVGGRREIIKTVITIQLGGRPHLLESFIDISERMQAQQALADSEALLRSIFDSVQDGIIVAEAQTRRFQMVNASICRMLGYSPNEMLQFGLEGIHPVEQLDYLISQFERLGRGEIDVALALPMQREDGSIFYADVSSGLMMINGVACIVGVFRDITEHRLAEEKIRQLNKSLNEKIQQLLAAQEDLVRKEKLALLGQVVGCVGHELRNPLAVMNNAVYFLQTVLVDADETTREYLEIIKNGVDDSERIVADLLDSVRIKPPHPAAIGVGELINQTLRTLTVPATMTVTQDLPETLPPVWVDGRQIQQVFRNLIGNGVEAMPEGGTLAINAVENSQERTVSVSVRDTGCGMPPEVLANLFQPLITTKARGIGLGLVVVKNLTEANGGTIMVESAVGQGTTFTVALPTGNSSIKES